MYDTHHKVGNSILVNDNYNVTYITAGISWKITPKVSIKSDYQFYKTKNADNYSQMINVGIGLMF